MSDILNIERIGEKKLELFKKLNINNLCDALNFYPKNYEDKTIFRDTKTVCDNEKVSINLMVATIPHTRLVRKGLVITKFTAIDDFGRVEITAFNSKYLQKTLKVGDVYSFFGVYEKILNKITVTNPQIDKLGNGSIVPIYSTVKGLSQADIRRIIYEAIKNTEIEDILPKYLREKYKFDNLKNILIRIHFPKTLEDVKIAKRRILFEEFFIYFVKLEILKAKKRKLESFALIENNYDAVLNKLNFTLTNSQVRSINEAIEDMKKGYQMNRLLQGDVGSGKTIVAEILSYLVIQNGKQVAFLVPTEVLANQHFNEAKNLFPDINIALLTSSTKKKKILKEQIKSGEVQFVIGTHAILTDDTQFFDLGLVIVDEQHRFGVMQRAKISAKGENPHMLVMSATPIPRTLALMMYGDLEISVLDTKPSGRKNIETFVVDESKRARIDKFIYQHIKKGEQVYVVCPLVEENEELKSAKAYFENMVKKFSMFKVGLIYGKMKACEKDEIMQKFKNGEINILVSTTVIEVGINVPNATIMVIENAGRFGLSALHQLRGRVGRSDIQSYCILFSAKNTARLDILTKTNDGFQIAKEDLNIRGAGDFFGKRQSGASEFKLFDSSVSMEIIKYANNEAKNIIISDEKLENYTSLHKKITKELFSDDFNIYN